MTLTDLKQKKVFWVIGGLLVVVIILVAMWSLRSRQPDTPTLPGDDPSASVAPYNPNRPQNVRGLPETRTESGNLTITGDALDQLNIVLPSEPIQPPESFQVTQYNPEEKEIDEYAKEFGFENQVTENIYKDRWNNSSISYDKYSGMYTYYSEESKHSHPEGLASFDETKVKTTAANFLINKLGLTSPLLEIKSVEYLKNEGAHADFSNIQEADFAEVFFVYSSGNQQAFANYLNSESAARILIDRSYHIVKATFLPINLTPRQELSLASLKVEEAIRSNNIGYFDLMYNQAGYPVSPQELISVQVDTIEIQYHIQPETGLTYPMYVFDGSGTTSDNQVVKVRFKTPAVPIR